MENETLKNELAAYRSDADMVKSMLELDTDVKEKQLKVLQETIRNLQTQLLENNAKEKETMVRIGDLEARLKQAHVKELLLKTKIVEASSRQHQNQHQHQHHHQHSAAGSSKNSSSSPDSDDSSSTAAAAAVADGADGANGHHQHQQQTTTTTIIKPPEPAIHPDEARIIGLVSTFLVVHPFGASLDYVFSYVQRAAPQLRPKHLEEILARYDRTFSEEVSGVGAKIERKWKFCGFDIEQE